MRHTRRLLVSLPLALLPAVAGCNSGHGSGHVGSIPQDDYKNAPISGFGPGASYGWSSSGEQTPPNGNPGPLPPGHGSGGTVHIGGKP